MGSDHQRSALRTLSAFGILKKARQMLGAVHHPTHPQTAPLTSFASPLHDCDLDLDETLETGEIFVSFEVKKFFPLSICIDTSLSMTGDKLAWTAVALALILLQFASHPLGLITFESQAAILKRPIQEISPLELIQLFLDVPADGYTDLEDGLVTALKVQNQLAHLDLPFAQRPATLLMTDGKYTAGRDPTYLAHRFHRLLVIKMGSDRSSLELCRDLARLGHGNWNEVSELGELPKATYNAVKMLLR